MQPTPKTSQRQWVELADLRACDVMQRDVVSVRASDTVAEVERVLTDARISGLPVIDDNDRVVGVLSTKDLVRRRADGLSVQESAGYGVADELLDDTEPMLFDQPDGQPPCAGDLMTTEVVSVGPEATLVEVAGKMVENEVHRLLVVEGDKLLGLISTMDLLRPLAGLPARARW